MISCTIDQYTARMMALAQEQIPKETKRFLTAESAKLKSALESYANQNVPSSRIPQSEHHRKYNISFEKGKTYKYNGALSKRVFNRAGYGWFVESGRPVARGYKRSRGYKNIPSLAISKHYNVYHTVLPDFQLVFQSDCQNWIDRMFKKGKL